MSLVELIARADERSLAASGLACLDRCVPLLGPDDEVLRPLWSSIAASDGWAERLAETRAALPDKAATDSAPDEACALVLEMLDNAPAVLPSVTDGAAADGPLRAWADACSVAALRIHRLLDTVEDDGPSVTERREGQVDGMSPLVAAELRRQTRILRLLADHGTGALRQVLEVSTEGRRVLRAVVSRRTRGMV